VIKYLKKILCFLLIAATFSVLAIPTQKVDASWNASNIISNNEFTAKNTMTEAEIQAFLVSKGNYLANYTVPAARYVEWKGVNYYENPLIGPFGGEVNATGWRASRVIYNVSQWYNINPQVILATIQKESSLVTTSPAYYGLVQWAMGYAYTDGGIRNVCNSGTNNNPTGSCAGFAMQIDWGGGMLGVWANKGGHYNFPVGSTKSICFTYGSTSCSNTYISNAATSVLYAYTPYFHGNQNFSYFYNFWFNYANYLQSVITFSEFTTSNKAPARGEDVTVSFKLKNNLSESVTMSAVGAVGRLVSPYSNYNRDFGWQGPVTFAAGEQKAFTFTRTIREKNNHYAWAAFNYQGSYVQYNNWGN
jgi:hypothetical protein